MISAGSVKITPAARDSPADAAVCTTLFSRMFDSRKKRRIAIEITAAGIDADTVSPAKSPRYAFAPASTADSTMPRTIALAVSCGNGSEIRLIGDSRWLWISSWAPRRSLRVAHQTLQRLHEDRDQDAAADRRQHDLRIERRHLLELLGIEAPRDDAGDDIGEAGRHEP